MKLTENIQKNQYFKILYFCPGATIKTQLDLNLLKSILYLLMCCLLKQGEHLAAAT